MNWKHGYYADSGYTYGYYPETMPVRLRWASLIQAHDAPEKNFRYLDAGCGQGLNLVLAAIAHPDSEFVGIDFLPEHIAHARTLARRCGLSNVTFIEGDFIELAANPASLGEFDYAVCHGITTWIAPPVKSALFRLIGQVLKPGGVFYNSYNTFPGWLGTVPFQHLVLLEQRSQSGAAAIKAAQKSMEHLREHSGHMFASLPNLTSRIKAMESQDPAYLVQEYNNQFWQPVFVTQMIDDLAAVKLNYLGIATLTEAYDTALPAQVRELLAQQQSQLVREQLRDYAINQSFRRDLYVKGQVKPWLKQQNDLVKACRLCVNPQVPRPEEGKSYVFRAGGVELNGAYDFYSAVLDVVAAQPHGAAVGEVLAHFANDPKRSSVVQALSMMLVSGYLMPVQDLDAKTDTAVGQRANAAMAAAHAEGAPYNYLALPRTGCAIQLPDTEWFMVDAMAQGLPPAQWADHVIDGLASLNRVPSQDGKAVTDRASQRTLITDALQKFEQTRLPFLRQMGAMA